MAYLELQDIKKSYYVDGQTFHVLNGISLNFNRGEFVSILGESGGGKTTLMNIIAGLDSDYSGNVVVNGKSLKHDTDKQLDEYRRNTIGFVFQNFNLISHLTIKENVMVSLEMTTLTREQQEQRALELLKKVGLYDHRNKYPNQLSGGQKQRVSIARALASDPDIIIADEPTGALDAENTDEILKLMNEIAEDGKLVIAVTHSQTVADYGTRIVHLADGKIDEDKILKKAYPVPKQHKDFSSRPADFLSIFKMAFAHFRYNLKRNLLIMFGAAIGIFSVIFMLGLGNGVKGYMNHEINSQVNPSTAVVKRKATVNDLQSSPQASEVTNQDLKNVKKIKNVESAVPAKMLTGGQLRNGSKSATTQLLMTTYPGAVLPKDIKAGKLPKNNQIFINKTTAKSLNAKKPYSVVGQQVNVVGTVQGNNDEPAVVKKTMTVSGVQDNASNPAAFMTYNTMKSMLTSSGVKMVPSAIAIKVGGGVKGIDPVQSAIKKIKDNNGKQRFAVTGPGSIINTLNTYVNLAIYILAAVAAISLLVSAIMIIVVLYISVAERTKEIGILRALGFTKGNIRNLFFCDAFFLGIFSSIGAVIIAYIVEWLANMASLHSVAFAIVQISPLDAVSSVILFIIICLLAALAPAAKAAKLDPVVSLSAE